MSSCLDSSELTVVVWKLNPGLKHLPPVVKSKPFLLLDSERNLEVRLSNEGYGFSQITLELYLRPPLRSLPEKTSVQFSTVWVAMHAGKSSPSMTQCNTMKEELDKLVEWRNSEDLCDICEIFCSFRCVLPLSESLESETIRFRPLDSNLESLSSDLGRFLEDKTFTDVTLKCGDRTISAHRAILAARSPIFAAMFRNKMAERENGVVELKDLDPNMLEPFLEYLYSGRITDLSENNVSTYFSNSDKYAVPALQQECSDWITEHLTRENYISFLELADAHKYEDLKNNVVEFIAKDYSVLKSEEWSQFNEMNPKLAISIYQKYIDKLVTIT